MSRSGAFTSRSGTGEGSHPQFPKSTSSAAPRSSIAVQSNDTLQPGFAGETDGEPLASAAGRATRTMSRFELRFGCAARGGPQGQGKTIADAKLRPDKMVWERKKPLTRPATAGESAIAGHPLPKREGYISDLGTPGVQPKIWGMISPRGEGGPGEGLPPSRGKVHSPPRSQLIAVELEGGFIRNCPGCEKTLRKKMISERSRVHKPIMGRRRSQDPPS